MKIGEIADMLSAKVICGADKLENDVTSAFASDLMSDVLTLDPDRMVLITGLTNTQTIRTAEMADISCIVFVRGKKVSPEMQQLACDNNMVLMECSYSMFRTVGILYDAGLSPVY